MQKKWLMGFPDRESQKKLWKIMKLTIVLLISFMMTLSAANTYSQKTRMDVNLSNATIKGVLGYIEQNSEFVFLYRSEDFNTAKKVDIELKDATINQILDEALHGEKVVYDVYERQIVIRKANELPITTQQTQKREISGTVKDVKGLPIPGVSVVVKSTTIGIITDSDGNYRLSAPTDSKIIVYSFIGMKVQEISLSGKNLINVVMEEEATALDEVVAIGYGTARRKDLTGSVSSVSGSALKDIPVTSAALAIVGRMAGVQVTKTEGSPDADIKIRIRGGGSLTQDNSPLYIVDGFLSITSMI